MNKIYQFLFKSVTIIVLQCVNFWIKMETEGKTSR